jgi:hypothetical protein
VVIDFYSDEELDRIYAIITRGVANSAVSGDAAPIPVDASVPGALEPVRAEEAR